IRDRTVTGVQTCALPILHGFAMFYATPEEQRRCSVDINQWLAEKKLNVLIGKTFPLAKAAAAHRLQEDNTLNKAGSLSGKIVLRSEERRVGKECSVVCRR